MYRQYCIIMKQIVKFLILTILTRVVLNCTAGCMICNRSSVCLFCDYQGYFLSGISCQKKTSLNCLYNDQSGFCLQCNPNYYVDFVTGRCIEVPLENLVIDCQFYTSSSICSSCVMGSILGLNKCSKIQNPIPNCNIHDPNDSTACLKCQNQYVLNSNGKTCLFVGKSSDCSGYSVANCKQCFEGFSLNKNLYINTAYSVDDIAQMTKHFYWDNIGLVDQGTFPSCIEYKANNCETYQRFDRCATCKESYYFNPSTFQCDPYPLKSIINCVAYSNQSSCIECDIGYILLNSQSCQKADPTASCLKFDPTKEKLVCLQCNTTFYLASNSQCVSRVDSLSIDKCKTYDPKRDSCLECNDQYTLNSNKLKCLLETKNCEIYVESTPEQTSLVCSKCFSGFLLRSTDKACLLGTVQDCITYDSATTNCLVCASGYFLNNGLCSVHPTVDFCKTLSPTQRGLCLECSINTILVTNQNLCMMTSKVPFCVTYSSLTQCSVCQEGYEINANKECIEIKIPVNCLIVNANRSCQKCKTGFFLDDGLCKSPDFFLNDGCQKLDGIETTKLTDLNCSMCKSNNVPFNFKNSFSCLPQSSIPEASLKENCIRYLINSGVYECLECSNNYVINLTGFCVKECPSGSVLLPIEVRLESNDSNPLKFIINKIRLCSSVSVGTSNCAIAFPQTAISSPQVGGVSYSCQKCLNGFIPSLTFGISNNVFQTKSADNGGLPTSPLAAFPGIECVSPSTVVFESNVVGSPSALTANCKQYYRSSTYGGCYVCDDGYSGPMRNINASAKVAVISSCSPIPFCVSGMLDGHHVYNRVNAYLVPLGALYSCHQCSADRIPFLAIRIPNTGETNILPFLTDYGMNTANPSAGTGGWHTACLNPSDSAQFGGLTASNYIFPTSCGLGVINARGTSFVSGGSTASSPAANTANVFCYACLPGFVPLRSADNAVAPLSVRTCTRITSCSSSTWFNACSLCLVGFAYPYVPASRTANYASCVSSPDPSGNCYIVDNSVIPITCKFCKQGFVLNSDNICEALTASKCTSTGIGLSVTFEISTTSNLFEIGLFLMPKGPGCLVCEQGFVGMKVSRDLFVCLNSPYLISGIYTPSTLFNKNCLNYFVKSNKIVCLVCKEDFVVSTKGSCYSKSSFPNCGLTDDSSVNLFCSVCDDGYVPVLGKCTQATIDNCVTFDLTSTQSQKCKVCKMGFYEESGLCVATSVLNCSKPSTKTLCLECENLYTLINLSSGIDYCYPIPKSVNCLSMTNQIQNGNIVCSKCSQDYFLEASPASVNKVCAPVNQIPNCILHEISTVLKNSPMVCSQCAKEYFLQNNKCLLRVNYNPSCLTYETSLDLCSKCSFGHFLAPEKTNCILNPQGIPGCLKYSSLTVCSQCDKMLYFLSDKCVSVPNESLIANCKFYSSKTSCVECEYAFVIVQNRCVESSAIGCLTYGSINSCATCPKGQGFRQGLSSLNCVAVNQPNCDVYEMTFPFNCITCNQNYYSNNGVCSVVSKTISFCKVYNSPFTCEKCVEGYILTQEKDKCVRDSKLLRLFDSNCAIMSIETNPVCVKCGPGFTFRGNNCVPCDAGSGCYVCAYDDAKNCLMCQSGFYQVANKSCIKIQISINGSISTNFTDANNKHSHRFYGSILMVFTLVFLRSTC